MHSLNELLFSFCKNSDVNLSVFKLKILEANKRIFYIYFWSLKKKKIWGAKIISRDFWVEAESASSNSTFLM